MCLFFVCSKPAVPQQNPKPAVGLNSLQTPRWWPRASKWEPQWSTRATKDIYWSDPQWGLVSTRASMMNSRPFVNVSLSSFTIFSLIPKRNGGGSDGEQRTCDVVPSTLVVYPRNQRTLSYAANIFMTCCSAIITTCMTCSSSVFIPR